MTHKCHKSKRCPPRQKQQRSLNILLSGDDGLTPVWLELYDELVARGHNVWGYITDINVSGTGGGLIARTYVVTQFDPIGHPRVYTVSSANPARATFVSTTEAVVYGVSQLAQDEIPLDLILLGPNIMEHLGSTELLEISGTMGGTVFGSSSWLPDPYLELPAIGTALPVVSSVARRTYAVQVVANLVEYLDRHRGEDDRLLPKGIFLNVNIPSIDQRGYLESCGTDLSEPLPKGVVLTKSGRYFNSSPLRQEDRQATIAFPDHSVATNIDGLGPFLAYSNFLTDRDFPQGFSAQVVAAVPYNANTPLTNAAQVAGKLVLVQAGGCFASVKLQNVIDAGGIGMILVNLGPTPTSAGSSIAVTQKLPSVTLGSTDGALIKAQLDAMVPVTLTITDFVEDDEVLYYLGFPKLLIPEHELDLCQSSDTNAFREHYVTITPGSQNYTFALDCKKVDELCCLFKNALTAGPNICSKRSRNRTSEILPGPLLPSNRNINKSLNLISDNVEDADSFREKIEQVDRRLAYAKRISKK